jgi:hypothetical protein
MNFRPNAFIIIKEEEKVLLVGCPDCYQCFEIQLKLDG